MPWTTLIFYNNLFVVVFYGLLVLLKNYILGIIMLNFFRNDISILVILMFLYIYHLNIIVS